MEYQSVGMTPARGWLSFRRIVDVPFETCMAALDSRQRARQGGELWFGESLLRGPAEHDRDSGTCRIQVRLARGPLRPMMRMRLDIDRWSSSSTAVELIPCGRVRPTTAYFRAGHLLLDALTRSLRQHVPHAYAAGIASQPYAPMVPGVLSAPRTAPRAVATNTPPTGAVRFGRSAEERRWHG